MSKRKMLWELFISTLYLSTFTFGGGFVIVTLMKKKMVDQHHWIDEKEMFYSLFKDNVIVQVILNGMRIAVAAIILDVVWSMAKGLFQKRKVFYIIIMFCAFVATYIFEVNAVLVLACCIVAGIGKTMWKLWKLRRV